MILLKSIFVFFLTRTAFAGYGIDQSNYGGAQHSSESSSSDSLQSDVRAPSYLPSYLKYSKARAYSSSSRNDHSYGTKTVGVKTAGVKTGGVKTHGGYNSPNSFNNAACSTTIPQAPVNSIMRCRFRSSCTFECLKGYQFPNGNTARSMYCNDGNWIMEAPQYATDLPCEPICLPACENNGICVMPGECNCPENFSGPQCQHEKKPCMNYPLLPMNTYRSCSSDFCTIKCADNHQFPDGTTLTNMICREGQWVPSRADWVTVPDCKPMCDPACQNGGVCLSLNTCQCPQAFRGPQCQYSAGACSVVNLGFNGGYSCSGDAETFSCKLNCPPPTAFTSPPAQLYTCRYSTGRFEPQPIPQCEHGSNIIITQGGSSKSIYYHGSSMTHHGEEVETISRGEIYEGVTRRPHQTKNDSNIVIENETGYYGENVNNLVGVLPPKPGVCFTWGGTHYKTFDGQVYSFQSPCRHTLVRESVNHSFKVVVKHGGCKKNAPCPSEVSIFLQDKEYIITKGDDGGIIFRTTKRLIPIPASLPGLRVMMSANTVTAELDFVGATVKWDTYQLVQVVASESIWNRTEGLCGVLDGRKDTDLLTKDKKRPKTIATLADSWQLRQIGDICDGSPTEQSACSKQTAVLAAMAEKFCTKLLNKTKFQKCANVMDISLLLEACQWDYCGCSPEQDPEDCACSSLSVYAKQCVLGGVEELKQWRDDETCPMKCTDGKIYKACGPEVQPSCTLPAPSGAAGKAETCTEGCFCPEGMFLDEGKCVRKQECPCRLRNRNFKTGSVINKGCNTCTCDAGVWTCTELACSARCGAIGDPHYTTFDGKHYDFMGKCSYTLLKGENYTVDVQNVECAGAISKAMNLARTASTGNSPSCTKAVTISYGAAVIKLKQRGVVMVNGVEVTSLPALVDDIVIRTISSLFLIVELPNGVDISWDGITRVFVDVPGSFRDKTKGLCGTFNHNQKDDFLTPEGDIEQSVPAFVNKWKTREMCDDVEMGTEPVDPCKTNAQNKPTAEKYCNQLKSKIFEECHWFVDVEPFYDNCMFDMCACDGKVSDCLCDILGAYAMECATQGVKIDWRLQIKECETHCTGGQFYQVCADSCTRTCSDVSHNFVGAIKAPRGKCEPKCVEGCACANGEALDKNGECVPVGSCPCHHDGLEFPAGYKEVRPGKNGNKALCKCFTGKWLCHPATPEEIIQYPRASDIKDKCSADANLEFTTCETAEPLTCKNMHLPQSTSPAECKPGCQCKKGYVLETVSKKCIRAVDCPCHHGGQSYPDGHKRPEECNTCECKRGKWECTERQCNGVCNAWGDSHFTTFDGKNFDFQGVCTYLMAQGIEGDNIFTVEIQNEPCGTTGATCAKSIVLKVGHGIKEESVSLTKHNPLPDTSKLDKIKLREAGPFVFLDVPSLDMTLQWDKATRVYVKVDPKWKGRVKGLCGNYNGDVRDDFQTPSGGGMAEASPLLFADSWMLSSSCPPATALQDYCEERPFRKEWATTTCGAINRPPFTSCHSEVPPAEYIQRCERDACACDSGGDCECVCIALATYSQLCAARGVIFKWRSKDLCPCQCDEETSSYDPCMSACPDETCENTLDYEGVKKSCKEDVCIEGCKSKKTCPQGSIFANNTYTECVPRTTCRPPCMTLDDGRVILEGEVLEEDACHTCRCSRKQRVCTGQPCSTVPPATSTVPTTIITSTPPSEVNIEDGVCKTGWSQWINKYTPSGKVVNGHDVNYEHEDLPSLIDLTNNLGLGSCVLEIMTDIECRTVGEHTSYEQTHLDTGCSLDRGLLCRSTPGKMCPDFEVRVLCQCDETAIPPIIPHKFPQCLDAIRPNHEHPTDCHKFYQCVPGSGPPEHPNLVLKSCGDAMLYNPATMTCDWPDTVRQLRPECAGTLTTGAHPETTTARRVTTPAVTTAGTTPSTHGTTPYQETTTARRVSTPGVTTAGTTPSTHGTTLYQETTTARRVSTPAVTTAGTTPSAHGTTPYQASTTEKLCPDGAVWSECAVPCNQLCHSYSVQVQKIGQCLSGKLCEPGCVRGEVASKLCEAGSLWRDQVTCVPKKDCTCAASNGDILKPGAVKEEQQCITCQCLDNLYNCDESACVRREEHGRESKPPMKPESHVLHPALATTTAAPPILIVTSTMTPPPVCTEDRYINLLWDSELPNSAFTASSISGNLFAAYYAVLNGRADVSAGSWSPEVSDLNQYIQVEFPRREPIYGVIMQGSPIYDQYVSSYDVMYGDDGHTFTYVKGPDDQPTVFRGSFNNRDPVKQLFAEPIEAKYVRIKPLTWHNEIAVRFDIIGCSVVSVKTTTSVPAVTQELPQCIEPMGLGKGALPISNVLVSSEHVRGPKKYLDVSQENAWRPIFSTPGEWVFFDFTGPRNITGIVTKGGKTGWVKSYTILYSLDKKTWSPITDSSGNDKVLPANIDSNTPVTNMFPEPIHLRYLKVLPAEWEDNIEMRIEPLGCPPYHQKLSELPQCTEPIGLGKASLPLSNVIVSSEHVDGPKKYLDINQENAWRPIFSTSGEWIFFDFNGLRNITGIVTKGGKTGWVKSYNILYSLNKKSWIPITDDAGNNKVFPANVDADTPVTNMFPEPIHLRYLKVLPADWQENIEMRIEPLGCPQPQKVTELPQCIEPMGLGKGALPPSNVLVSSEHASGSKNNLDISQDNTWRPLYSTPGEWIFFDFTGPRNITGIVTKGGKTGWVKSYTILYSLDKKSWNPITDDAGNDKVFPANFDFNTPVTNMFPRPIHLRYLKVLPAEWEDNIEMRIEPLGCFVPYPPAAEQPDMVYTLPPELPGTTPTCDLCPGIVSVPSDCSCTPPKSYFNGENCTTKALCPCFVGLISYQVGATFKSKDCEECTCKMGGVADCVPTKCPKCSSGLVSKKSQSCDCFCEPCSPGERVCPTSQVCIPEQKWCDGVTDCPDDELDCATATTSVVTEYTTTTTVKPTTLTTTTVKPELKCPKPSCPPGYTVKIKKSRPSYQRYQSQSDSPMLDDSFQLPPPRPRKTYQRFYKGVKGGAVKTYSGTKTRNVGTKQSSSFTVPKPSIVQNTQPEPTECQQFACIRPIPPLLPGHKTPPPMEPCAVPTCPKEYKLKVEPTDMRVEACPRYRCEPPPPTIKFAICNVTGATFDTFDGTEYKYEICNHLLARDSDKWSVFIQKNCTKSAGCVREILITEDGDQIRLLPSLQVEYNGYLYTVDQAKKIGHNKQTFDLSRLGNVLVYMSRKYFWVSYNPQGDVKIGVSQTLSGLVDGLCGYFDGKRENDRRMPDGAQAVSTDVFANAWAKPDLPPDACEATVCPLNLKTKAWEMCNAIYEKSLSICGKVLDLQKWRARCLERICDCAVSSNGSQRKDSHECLCEALQCFVVECQSADRTIDLQGWRTEMKCPAECPAPLVHHDCYRRRCEPSCSTLVPGSEQCPLVSGFCSPGCFCPEGKLRKGDECVTPQVCRDCVCDGLGTPAKYNTFEQAELPFSGNCTYIVARDKNDKSQYKFQVFVTNGACENDAKSVCAEAVHVIYGPHVLHVQKNTKSKKLETTVDGSPVYTSLKTDWLLMTMQPDKEVSILIPEVQLEVTSLFKNMAFSVKVPSYLYANKTEGLCGNCGGFEEELVMENGTVTTDVEEYGLSWLAGKPVLDTLDIKVEETCVEKPKNECVPLPPDQDPCFKILDPQKFEKCHQVVDPVLYLTACQQDLCQTGKQVGVCSMLEQYDEACRKAGICLEWRSNDFCPYPCADDMEYKSCGLGCTLTCDNYDALTKHPKKCGVPPTEGCFCPEGKVLVNNTCIEHDKCFPCDAEQQHFAGDEWQVDACTKCSCSKSDTDEVAHVSCTKQSCATPACSKDEVAVKLSNKPTDCCPKYICVVKTTESPQCEEPQPILCGFGQELVLEKTAQGCKQFLCKCKPASECEPLPNPNDVPALEPGMKRLIDESGCCPKAELVCKPETCPQPPACPQFKDLKTKNVPGKCCPDFECALPKDRCLVTLEWEAAPKGGEKRKDSPETLLKHEGATWLDGPCRSCHCQNLQTGPAAQCSVTECPAIVSTADLVVEPQFTPFTCCPVPAYVACRHENEIYKIGEKWKSPGKPCESYECVQTDGRVQKHTTIEQCDTKCKPGWEYVPPNAEDVCCGSCKPFACVVNGTQHKIGDKWQSPDYCTLYSCDAIGDNLQIRSTGVVCPSVPESLHEEFEVRVISAPGNCCDTVKPVACRVGGVVYQEGASWPTADPCKNVSCARDSAGRLAHVEAVQSCSEECARGWTYRPAADNTTCCGQCEPTACTDGYELRAPESTWKSSDNCTMFMCSNIDGQLVVSSHKESCPDISDCPDDNIYWKGCCEYCNQTALAQSTCTPESLPGAETIGLIKIKHRKHGQCSNEQPLDSFKECRGHCASGTIYNKLSGNHDSDCKCCQVTKVKSIKVTLDCTNGNTVKHQVAIPAECSCEACVEQYPQLDARFRPLNTV